MSANNPYRTMELPKEPQFTFTEKLFLSKSKLDKFWMHSILIGKPIAKLGVAGAAITAIVSMIGAVVYGVSLLVETVKQYFVSHGYISSFWCEVLFMVSAACLVMLVSVIFKIKEMVAENNYLMWRSIKDKLNQ